MTSILNVTSNIHTRIHLFFFYFWLKLQLLCIYVNWYWQFRAWYTYQQLQYGSLDGPEVTSRPSRVPCQHWSGGGGPRHPPGVAGWRCTPNYSRQMEPLKIEKLPLPGQHPQNETRREIYLVVWEFSYNIGKSHWSWAFILRKDRRGSFL